MKKIIVLLALLLVFTGSIFASEIEFINVGNGLNFNLMQTGGINPYYRISYLSDGSGYPGYLIGGFPFIAGMYNTIFGLWSWIHQDWLGGGITAGLMVGGAILGSISASNNDMDMAMVSFGALLGGMIYGYWRGSSQFRQMQAARNEARQSAN